MIGVISPGLRWTDGIRTCDGATWYRAILPLTFAAAHGVSWIAGTEGKLDGGVWILCDGELYRPDTIVFCRAYSVESYQTMQAAKEAGQRVVLDLDDAIWDIPPQNEAHPLSVRSHSEGVAWIARQCQVVDRVVVSTEYLGDSLYRFLRRELGKQVSQVDIVVVPNMIDITQWSWCGWSPGRRLGWTGSIKHRDIELSWITQTLQRAQYWGWQAVHVGIGQIPSIRSYGPYHASEWHRSAQHFDVGLAAVADTAFSRCKSDVKALEFAAAAKPFIAYGYPYRGWRDVACVLDRPGDIEAALRRLADPTAQEEMSQAVKAQASTRDIRQHWSDFVGAWGVWTG